MQSPKVEWKSVEIEPGVLHSFSVKIIPADGAKVGENPIAKRTMPDGTVQLIFLMTPPPAGQGTPTTGPAS